MLSIAHIAVHSIVRLFHSPTMSGFGISYSVHSSQGLRKNSQGLAGSTANGTNVKEHHPKD